MTFSIQNAQCITLLDDIADACDVGTGAASATLVIYDGTPPARASAALSGNTVLAQLAMSNPAFGAAVDVPASHLARVTASAITDDSSADATGTATFFRILDRDGAVVVQGSAGATGAGTELELNSVSIVAGAAVEVTSLIIDMPESA